jgi:alcohol dehydrogenase
VADKSSGSDYKDFGFKLITDMKFGIGISRNLGELLTQNNFGSLGLVVDSVILKSSGLVRDLVENLRHLAQVVTVFENNMAEPDYDYLDRCRAQLGNYKFDTVVAVGGGSTLDLAKGIAVLMTNPGNAITYKGFNLVKNPALPVIAIPTTAGTGSEVTPTAVFIDRRERRKLGINTEYVRPRMAVLDASLTLSCPKNVTVSSGMDALLHALESYISRTATPASRLFAGEGFSLIFNNLTRAVDDLNNVELRAKLLLGSYYAGIALMNSGAAAAHALSYPLGVHFNVPHGLAGAVFLPRVTKMNVEMGCLAYTPLFDLIEGADHTLSEVEKNKAFLKAVNAFCRKLSVPESLKPFGVSSKDVDSLLEDSMKWRKEAIEQNPVLFDRNQVREIWESLV